MEIITKTIIDVKNTLKDNTIYQINLGIFMRKVRLERKKTQTQVANAIGVTFQQVQKYEKGSNAISLYNLLTWWEYLKPNKDLGVVLKNCADNVYLRQIFKLSTNEDQLDTIKDQVLKQQVDLKRFDAFIDI
tara:strand:- start:74 stop:469 length:396 start_codon:yes stop_codon:yes gene_type:complete